MRLFLAGIFLSASLVLASSASIPGDDVSTVRRLHDLSPASETNPVVARVPDCGIEITLRELQAFVKSVPSPNHAAAPGAANRGPLGAPQKRRSLEALLDEHFLLWDGYRQKADHHEGLIRTLENTETMLMRETLVQHEVIDQAKTRDDYQRLSRTLLERLWEKTDIFISGEALTELRAAVFGSAARSKPLQDGPDVMTGEARKHVLARGATFALSSGDVLANYFQIPPARRPDIATHDGLEALLKAILGEHLIDNEARARGLDKAPRVVELLQLNRNTLVRMYALDQLANQAAARMKEPNLEGRLRAWYEVKLKSRYTWKDESGKEGIIPFDQERERIQNDYFDALNEGLRAERVRTLREGRSIEVDEELLARSVIQPPETTPARLAPSVVAWNADRQEYRPQADEVSTAFTFRLTNVSDESVTIHAVTSSCECTTVKTPPLPWKIAPGEEGTLIATVDLHGKKGSYLRTIEVESSHGPKTLTLEIIRLDNAAAKHAAGTPKTNG